MRNEYEESRQRDATDMLRKYTRRYDYLPSEDVVQNTLQAITRQLTELSQHASHDRSSMIEAVIDAFHVKQKNLTRKKIAEVVKLNLHALDVELYEKQAAVLVKRAITLGKNLQRHLSEISNNYFVGDVMNYHIATSPLHSFVVKKKRGQSFMALLKRDTLQNTRPVYFLDYQEKHSKRTACLESPRFTFNTLPVLPQEQIKDFLEIMQTLEEYVQSKK